jgi:hypothetical protein
MVPHPDAKFLDQVPTFLDQALTVLEVTSLNSLSNISEEMPTALHPTVIKDLNNLSRNEKIRLADAFFGKHGVSYFVVNAASTSQSHQHPLLILSDQLSDVLPLKCPISHPGEADRKSLELFGSNDGTLKVFQRDDQESSLESKELHLHQDGVGLGGSLAAVGLYCESGPLWGGFTCFQNGLRLALELARLDMEAFESLFRPTALTILRRTGPKALRVTGPVLYLNEFGQPQVFLRAQGGEYEMTWLQDDALKRARIFLEQYLKPFALASSLAQFSIAGQGCFIRNSIVLHGRTTFIESGTLKRVLARKWYTDSFEHARIMQVPGLRLMDKYAAFRPDLFGPDLLRGTWIFDDELGTNIQLDPPSLAD